MTGNTDNTSAEGGRHGRSIQDLREELLCHDPLLSCLVELARYHGRPSTRAALVAGLPLENGSLTPSLFSRAAARAGFSSRILRRPLDEIDDAVLPAILLLEADQACVLLGWNDTGDGARVLLPETGQSETELSRADLSERYLGIAIFARPRFRFDARAPEVGAVPQRHWFWGVLLEQQHAYRSVMLAALLINVFAVALPLFSMNVYDRVVPNNATDTLWVLMVGILLVFGMDFTVRLLRGHFIDLAGARIDVRLSASIMERVLGMRLEGRPNSVGSFASNLRSFESVRDFIASSTVAALIDFPFALIFLIAIAWISWPLVIIPLVGMSVGILFAYVIQHRMHELTETSYRAAAMRNAALIESLTALETIKTQRAEGVIQKKYESASTFLARVMVQTRLLSAGATNVAVIITQVVNVLLIAAGVYLIQERMLSMGGLIAVTMLGSRAMGPLSQAVGMLMQFQNARTSLETLTACSSR